MLEQYFVKPSTVDRLRGSWIATEIETYVAWLVDQGFSTKTVWRRVPIAFAFGEFARARGANAIGDLPAHIEPFVADRVAAHGARTGSSRPMAKEVRGRRTCPLWHQTAALVAELLKSANTPPIPDAPVFGSATGEALTRFGIYKVVRRHAAHLDDIQARRKVSPHLFRHTAAVHLLEAGSR